MAKIPTAISVRGTPRCNRFTAITVIAMKTKSKLWEKRVLAEAHHRGQDQANCRRRHAWQRRGDKSVIPVAVIDDADREHQHSAWKADADDCGDGAHHATQLFSDYDRHVGRIQTGKALADRQHLHEFLVVNPPPFRDEASAKVRHDAAKTRGSNDQKLVEDLES